MRLRKNDQKASLPRLDNSGSHRPDVPSLFNFFGHLRMPSDRRPSLGWKEKQLYLGIR
jgi:hypothetical protein